MRAVSDVEFLPDDGADETADHLHDRSPRPVRRWVLFAAALAAAVLVWVLGRPSDMHVASQATPTSRPSVPAVGSRATTPPTDRACDTREPCEVTSVIPSELRSALRAYLPHMSSLEVRTYLSVNHGTGSVRLAERDINAAAGSVSVLVKVQRLIGPAPPPIQIVSAPLGTGSVLVHRQRPGYVIDVQYLAPETVPPAMARLGALAFDSRLEAL